LDSNRKSLCGRDPFAGFRNLYGTPLGIAAFDVPMATGAAPLVTIDMLRRLRSASAKRALLIPVVF
jgi:hypothetical protein